MFAPISRLLTLFCCLTLAAQASSLVSLKATPLAPADAVAAIAADTPPPFSLQGMSLPLGVRLTGQRLPGLDAALTPLVAAVQDDTLFVLAVGAGATTSLWHYTVKTGWQPLASPPGALLPVAQAVGPSHILFLKPAPSGAVEVFGYHLITDTWASFGTWSAPGSVDSVRGAGNGFILTAHDPAGTITHTRLEITTIKRGLKAVDYVVIVIYLFGVAGIGLYFYLTGKKDTANFFLAGRKIPWWAAGLSLYATGTSAISYLAIPAKSYATNWLYLAQNVIGFVGTIYVGFVIVPLVRRLNLVSVYEYLEMRFHPAVRMIASLICIVQHLAGRMSIVLLLPSLALSAVTGISVVTCILIMGVITTVYTFLGGMKAVIWTDVLQVFVMVGGALFAMAWMIHGAGGFGEVARVAHAGGKTHLFDFSFDFTIPNVWIFVLLLIVGTLTWPQDQVMTQRVLSTKDDKAARNSVFMLTALVLPGSFMFFALGTLLYAYYKAHPASLNPLLATDQTFPQFIAAELPPGVTGLIIAGIFAASMATLSSNINSISTLVSVDFYERYAKRPSAAMSVRLAEAVTLLTGVIGTGLALYLSTLKIQSLFDKWLELFALLGGGFAGIYALGMFTRRANWQGAVTGIVMSLVMTLLAKLYTPVHVLMYMVISISSCMAFGYLGSWCFPAPAQSLRGLTIFDQIKGGVAVDPARLRGH